MAEASSIKGEMVNAIKERYIRILLKDYPDFNSIPENIQKDAIYDCKDMSIKICQVICNLMPFFQSRCKTSKLPQNLSLMANDGQSITPA